ncbi:hypothetical protein AVEN_111672-1 [Araneus ventricosus]|uniref:Uncharacterized protein n=1 Tax=Araneus ventricosus TaxID=182803 RepID=A0A4Y2LRL3_ARAVE|nr:hypothetical protein AVEN_111672-1 [Araneus ventricosus]
MAIPGHSLTPPEGGTHHHRHRTSPSHYGTHQGSETQLTYSAVSHPRTGGAPQRDHNVCKLHRAKLNTEISCEFCKRRISRRMCTIEGKISALSKQSGDQDARNLTKKCHQCRVVENTKEAGQMLEEERFLVPRATRRLHENKNIIDKQLVSAKNLQTLEKLDAD